MNRRELLASAVVALLGAVGLDLSFVGKFKVYHLRNWQGKAIDWEIWWPPIVDRDGGHGGVGYGNDTFLKTFQFAWKRTEGGRLCVGEHSVPSWSEAEFPPLFTI